MRQIDVWDVLIFLSCVSAFFTILLSAPKIRDWLERHPPGAGSRSDVNRRLARAEARLAAVSREIEDLRSQQRGSAGGPQPQGVATFPLIGVAIWAALGVGAMLALTAMWPHGMAYLATVFLFFYGVAGLTLFFSGDYAQQKWGGDER